MLKSLLYYEYRGLRRVGTLLLCLYAAAAVCAFGTALLLSFLEVSDKLVFIYSILVMLYLALLIVPAVLLAVSYVLVIYRFYATVFTDEGYLTLMLPLPRATLLLGKLMAGLIFMAGAVVCTVAAYFTALGGPALIYDTATVSLILDFLWELLTASFMDAVSWVAFALTLVDLLVRGVATVVLGYAAVIIGGVVMRRHKLLGAVLFAVVIYYIRELLDLALSLIVGMVFFNDVTVLGSGYTLTVSILSLLLSLGVVSVGYFVAHRIFTRRLELE